MSIKSLMNYTFVSKYARWDSEKLRRETWSESVNRVRQMMIDKYAHGSVHKETTPPPLAAIARYIDQAYDDMKKTIIFRTACAWCSKSFTIWRLSNIQT